MSTVPSQVPAIRARHIADAYEAIGRLNHYMVGFVGGGAPVTLEELEAAEQILIDRQNLGPQKGRVYEKFERALDLIEQARREHQRRG